MASATAQNHVHVAITPLRAPVTRLDRPGVGFLLRYQPNQEVGRRNRIDIHLKALEVARGAGVVVECSRGILDVFDEPPKYSSIPDPLERIELFRMPPSGGERPWMSTLEIEACMGHGFKQLAEPDVYYISYSHPERWISDEDDEDNATSFSSNTLVIAVVTEERLQELTALRESDPEVSDASYRFQHYSKAHPCPKGLRLDPFVQLHAKNAIRLGAERDEVLFMLGPPDECYKRKEKNHDYDETWTYMLSNIGGAWLYFADGELTEIAAAFDHPEAMVREGKEPDFVRFILGEPIERRLWREVQPDGYDEEWIYQYYRVGFLREKVLKVLEAPSPGPGKYDD